MSSKNRGTEVVPHEKYSTPVFLTDAMLPYILDREHVRRGEVTVLEPAAGNGAMMDRLLLLADNTGRPRINLQGADIEPERGDIIRANFLLTEPFPVDIVITNPPYSLAMPFVQHAFKFMRDEYSRVIMLLRLNWLGSKTRAKWLRENTPAIFVSPKRPSFTGSGSDSTEYCFMMWGKKVKSTITILRTEDV